MRVKTTMASSSGANGGASTLNIDITKFISPGATNRKHIAFKIRSNLVMKMLLDGLNTDITLEAKGGSRCRAHTSVLASCSPVFNAIFKTRIEKKINATVPEFLDEMTIEGLKLFVVLLYLMPVLQDTVIMNGLENAVIAHFDELVGARLKFKVVLFCRQPRCQTGYVDMKIGKNQMHAHGISGEEGRGLQTVKIREYGDNVQDKLFRFLMQPMGLR